MKQAVINVLVAVVMLAGCGKQTTENPVPPPVNPPPPSHDTYTLRMWGAHWCTNCDSVIKGVSEELAEPLRSGKLKLEIMVPPKKLTGETTVDDVTKCKEKVKLEVTYTADSKWELFKPSVSDKNFGIPAGALFDKNGKLVPYASPVDPSKLVVDVRNRIK